MTPASRSCPHRPSPIRSPIGSMGVSTGRSTARPTASPPTSVPVPRTQATISMIMHDAVCVLRRGSPHTAASRSTNTHGPTGWRCASPSPKTRHHSRRRLRELIAAPETLVVPRARATPSALLVERRGSMPSSSATTTPRRCCSASLATGWSPSPRWWRSRDGSRRVSSLPLIAGPGSRVPATCSTSSARSRSTKARHGGHDDRRTRSFPSAAGI